MFIYYCRYNRVMNENYNAPNSNCCGRPMNYAPKDKCNYNNCCLNEYKYTMPTCIRNKEPDCTAQAVIPAITVETADGLTNLANCFVHVTSNNTTYYVDDKHRPMMVWAGPVEVKDYNLNQNELGLRSQFCLTSINGVYTEVYFDRQGIAHIMGTEA